MSESSNFFIINISQHIRSHNKYSRMSFIFAVHYSRCVKTTRFSYSLSNWITHWMRWHSLWLLSQWYLLALEDLSKTLGTRLMYLAVTNKEWGRIFLALSHHSCDKQAILSYFEWVHRHFFKICWPLWLQCMKYLRY